MTDIIRFLLCYITNRTRLSAKSLMFTFSALRILKGRRHITGISTTNITKKEKANDDLLIRKGRSAHELPLWF